MSSLARVPLSLLTVYSITAIMSNPNRHTVSKERRPQMDGLVIYFYAKYHVHDVDQVLLWVAAIAEIAAILCEKAVGVAPSKTALTVLEFVVPGGRASDIRLTPISVIGAALIVAGSQMRLASIRELGSLFTFEITIRDNHRLVTSGPYSIVRHPSYGGWIIMCIGMCLWFGSTGSWVRESGILNTSLGSLVIGIFAAMHIMIVVGGIKRIPEEDKLMKEAFGKEWEEWALKVPYLLIPYVY